MQADYARFVGRPYQPPLGCLVLVQQVYRELYGIDLGEMAEGFEDGRALYRLLLESAAPVTDPAPGDVVLLHSQPWHVGVVIGGGDMLHSYEAYGEAVIEAYTGILWRSRIAGFYRYKGWA